ncbi:winged helix-turn-helix transcriptional regulator [Halorubrum lipolyticum]|uniref:HxlR family transcriptional regulator n=1 Tax=Halorubrum lipolyticum DSM 21995 TaxID=1227482 RepID=M0P5R2_9EURY|nr:helix-turn-helix domain-containing protein [Halorubrum lipolyticum]EMA64170.1 HxlR family transcriptional regulator [Halorubrum lipolyticum DSM 21995]
MSSQDLAGAEPADTTDSEPDTDASSDPSATSAPDTPCPVVDSLEQIGSRWRLVVLHELLNGESRFNELKRETDANARTLSRVLDDLQETGFVDRRLEEDSPVATYYSLTPKGESLAPVFEEIDDWAHEWLAECSN